MPASKLYTFRFTCEMPVGIVSTCLPGHMTSAISARLGKHIGVCLCLCDCVARAVFSSVCKQTCVCSGMRCPHVCMPQTGVTAQT